MVTGWSSMWAPMAVRWPIVAGSPVHGFLTTQTPLWCEQAKRFRICIFMWLAASS